MFPLFDAQTGETRVKFFRSGWSCSGGKIAISRPEKAYNVRAVDSNSSFRIEIAMPRD
jgi:hypothetical protein